MTINPLVHDKYNITGGAAKSIQSINVAAVAAAAAGLASPAATHHMKKLHVWRKTALILFLLQFFWRTLLFFPMCMSTLNSFCSKGGPMKENVYIYIFTWHILVRLWGICSICFYILLCIYFQVPGSNFPRTPSATSGSVA